MENYSYPFSRKFLSSKHIQYINNKTKLNRNKSEIKNNKNNISYNIIPKIIVFIFKPRFQILINIKLNWPF